MKDLASIPHNIAIEGKEAGLDDRRPGVMLQFSREAAATSWGRAPERISF